MNGSLKVKSDRAHFLKKILTMTKTIFFRRWFQLKINLFIFLNLVIISGIISDGAQYGKNGFFEIFNKKLCYAENGVNGSVLGQTENKNTEVFLKSVN